jgi:hypothetical protein
MAFVPFQAHFSPNSPIYGLGWSVAMAIAPRLFMRCTRNTVCCKPKHTVAFNLPSLPGTFVRLAPDHVSISDPEALQIVYAHGNGSLKSNFYDAFVSIQRGLFNTRNRTDHARKRKIVSHIFSQKSVIEFEPHVRQYVGELIQQWDRLCDGAVKGLSGTEGEGVGWVGMVVCGLIAFLVSSLRNLSVGHR